MSGEAAGDGFADLFPAPRRVTLLGRELAILPAALPHIPHATEVIEGWRRFVTADQPMAAFPAWVTDMLPALSALTGIPEGEIAACPAADLPALVETINHLVAVNAGFFARRVLPGLVAGIPEVRAAMGGAAGPKSLPASSAGATAGLN